MDGDIVPRRVTRLECGGRRQKYPIYYRNDEWKGSDCGPKEQMQELQEPRPSLQRVFVLSSWLGMETTNMASISYGLHRRSPHIRAEADVGKVREVREKAIDSINRYGLVNDIKD